MSLYTATVQVTLPDGEPSDMSSVQHALFDAVQASHDVDDTSLGAYASLDGELMQVVMVVEAADEGEAALKVRSLVLQVMSDEGEVASAELEAIEIVEGRDAFDALTELYEG